MIITIAHTKGGVGKSTLAWHIIFMYLLMGKRVKVIDLDFQQTTYFLNQIRVSSGLDGIEVEQPQDVEELISLLENYDEDIVIVDIGGFDNDINRTAISYADKILVPISNSVTEVLGFKTFEAILEDITTKHLDYPFVNVVLPLYGFDVKLGQSVAITVIFTVASIVRGYGVRRLFNYIHTKNLNKVGN